MSINHNKPVFVFNQDSTYYEIGWYEYEYDYDLFDFVKCEVPTLTKNFAGIGTREIKTIGIMAINDVYLKTLKSL